MKTLLLLRHAKSSWGDPSLADHDRPLNGRGKRDAPRIGELLLDEDLVPDVILSSTAKRAQATARAVAEASLYDGEVQLVPELYRADPEAMIELVQRLPDEVASVMLVGHNPEMEALLETLTDHAEPMSTAALAHIALPIDHWQELGDEVEGTLVHLWRPRELGPAASS